MLSEQIKATLKDACQKLTGPKKRAFIAKVAEDYFDASARKTETHLGWGRKSIQFGLHESRTGILCKDNYQARGNHKIIVINLVYLLPILASSQHIIKPLHFHPIQAFELLHILSIDIQPANWFPLTIPRPPSFEHQPIGSYPKKDCEERTIIRPCSNPTNLKRCDYCE